MQASMSLAGILLMAAMAFYAFYTSLGAARFSEAPCSRIELSFFAADPRHLSGFRPSDELITSGLPIVTGQVSMGPRLAEPHGCLAKLRAVAAQAVKIAKTREYPVR
jgi:hypothetical protein